MTSSSDEISSFTPSCTYDQQLTDIKCLISWATKHSFKLVIRHHPNLGRIGRPNEAGIFLDTINELQSPNLFVVMPWQNINTYRLAHSALFSICPQSTLSIDLPLLGFKTIALDYSPYSPFYNNSLNINLFEGYSPEYLVKTAYSNIHYSSGLEYLGFKHYLTTSFQGLRNDFFCFHYNF